MFGAAKREKAFKDYCLILQVHPEADAAMIDAAYWHLAKRYNEATAFDPKARARIEELNEAYIVLGNAEKREEYMKERSRVLGEGALPQVPRPLPPTPPLSVMTRQRPMERPEPATNGKSSRFGGRLIVGAFVTLGIVGVALAATLSLLVASAATAALLAVLLAVASVVAALPRLRSSGRTRRERRSPPVPIRPAFDEGAIRGAPPTSLKALRSPETPSPSAPVDLEQIERFKARTQKLRATAKNIASASEGSTQQEPTVTPERVDRAQIEQIKRETERARSQAEASLPADPEPTALTASRGTESEAHRVDRAEIEQIKREAEELRAAQRRSDSVNQPRQNVDEVL